MGIEEGDKIKVEYEGTLQNGEVFDSSEKQGEPLEFEVGAKQVVEGFDDAVIGMEEGEEKEVTLEPENAYGDRNPQLVQEVPKSELPDDQEVKEGMVLGMTLPNGKQAPATVVNVGDEKLKLDLNHPLAGKTLNFDLKIVEVN